MFAWLHTHRLTAAFLLGVLSMMVSVYALAKWTADIQESREQGVRLACQEQNDRHDNTIATLDTIIRQLPPGPQKDRAERNRASTVLLLKALAPKRDCEERVRLLT